MRTTTRMTFHLKFFREFLDTPEASFLPFSARKVKRLFLLKVVKPSSDRKIIKLLTFCNLFPFFAKTRSRMTATITFSHQFTRAHYLIWENLVFVCLKSSRSTRRKEIMYVPFSTIRFPLPVLCPSIVTTPLVGICLLWSVLTPTVTLTSVHTPLFVACTYHVLRNDTTVWLRLVALLVWYQW